MDYDTLLADHVSNFTNLMGRVDLNLGGSSTKSTDKLIDYYATESNRKTPTASSLRRSTSSMAATWK